MAFKMKENSLNRTKIKLVIATATLLASPLLYADGEFRGRPKITEIHLDNSANPEQLKISGKNFIPGSIVVLDGLRLNLIKIPRKMASSLIIAQCPQTKPINATPCSGNRFVDGDYYLELLTVKKSSSNRNGVVVLEDDFDLTIINDKSNSSGGSQGSAGPAGPQGPVGPQGPQGQSVKLAHGDYDVADGKDKTASITCPAGSTTAVGGLINGSGNISNLKQTTTGNPAVVSFTFDCNGPRSVGGGNGGNGGAGGTGGTPATPKNCTGTSYAFCQ